MTEPRVVGTYSCPQCNGDNRVFHNAHTVLEERGLHGKMRVYYAHRDVIQLMPLEKAILTVPVVTMYADICEDCGTEYFFMIETQDAPVKFIRRGGGQLPFSPS